MDEKHLEVIRWAQKPRSQSWRKWVRLLRSLSTPERPISFEQLQEFKPPIDLECEPLLGQMTPVGDARFNKRVNQLPPLSVRIRIFLKGIAIVKTFRNADDLMRLAVYRRQVTNVGPCPRVDRSLYQLIDVYFPELSADVVRDLAVRMPPHSEIIGKLHALADKKEKLQPLKLAAE